MTIPKPPAPLAAPRHLRKPTTAFGSKRLFHNLRDAIIVSSDKGHVLLQNNAAQEVFGFSEAEFQAYSFHEVFPDRGVQQVFAAVVERNLAGREEVHSMIRTEIVHKDGGRKVVDVGLSPIEDVTDQGGYVLAIVREVQGSSSHEVDQAKEITRLRAESAARADQVAQLHEDATRAAQPTNDEIVQLVNAAVHEIAQPLAAMQFQVEVLKNSIENPLEGQRRGFDLMARNLRRLLLLRQDLLEAVRLETGRMNVPPPRPLDLARTVAEVAEGFAPLAQQDGVILEVSVQSPLMVEGDPDRVAQVVTNLLQNALKFTPRGGTVAVRAVRSEDRAVVEVEDTGVGLLAEDIAKLFRPFSQIARGAPMRDGAPRGSGLGLFISKGIVEGHGGSIEVKSPGLQQGSTFRIALPLVPG